jgi:hypothetical protein
MSADTMTVVNEIVTLGGKFYDFIQGSAGITYEQPDEVHAIPEGLSLSDLTRWGGPNTIRGFHSVKVEGITVPDHTASDIVFAIKWRPLGCVATGPLKGKGFFISGARVVLEKADIDRDNDVRMQVRFYDAVRKGPRTNPISELPVDVTITEKSRWADNTVTRTYSYVLLGSGQAWQSSVSG